MIKSVMIACLLMSANVAAETRTLGCGGISGRKMLWSTPPTVSEIAFVRKDKVPMVKDSKSKAECLKFLDQLETAVKSHAKVHNDAWEWNKATLFYWCCT
jgi:hypothetical protein